MNGVTTASLSPAIIQWNWKLGENAYKEQRDGKTLCTFTRTLCWTKYLLAGGKDFFLQTVVNNIYL